MAPRRARVGAGDGMEPPRGRRAHPAAGVGRQRGGEARRDRRGGGLSAVGRCSAPRGADRPEHEAGAGAGGGRARRSPQTRSPYALPVDASIIRGITGVPRWAGLSRSRQARLVPALRSSVIGGWPRSTKIRSPPRRGGSGPTWNPGRAPRTFSRRGVFRPPLRGAPARTRGPRSSKTTSGRRSDPRRFAVRQAPCGAAQGAMGWLVNMKVLRAVSSSGTGSRPAAAEA